MKGDLIYVYKCDPVPNWERKSELPNTSYKFNVSKQEFTIKIEGVEERYVIPCDHKATDLEGVIRFFIDKAYEAISSEDKKKYLLIVGTIRTFFL